MKDLNEILKIAIITIFGKLGAAWSVYFSMPAVIGFLAVGFVLGPSVLDIIKVNNVVTTMADIGVIIILFIAGIETDLDQLRRQAKDALLAAVGGVVFPFVLALLLLPIIKYSFAQSLLMGTVLTATSVSITVQVLADMNKLRSKEGATILGAAIADDIMEDTYRLVSDISKIKSLGYAPR
ncbi:MAG TPA: cation:proton antiporter [Candidatus Atribacteria bacterium]|nr:cation:proton antiporter [Candidatus Atribacteria bacterium]